MGWKVPALVRRFNLGGVRFLVVVEFLLKYKGVFSYVIFGLLCLALVVLFVMPIACIWWVSSKDSPF